MSVSTRRTQRPPPDSNSDTDMEDTRPLLALPAPTSTEDPEIPDPTALAPYHQPEDSLQPLPYPQNDFRALIDAIPSAV